MKSGEVQILSPVYFKGSKRRTWTMKNPEEVAEMGIKEGDRITVCNITFRVEYATSIKNPVHFILKLRLATN